jgi:hypothetical protein
MRLILVVLLSAIPVHASAQYFGRNKVQYEHLDFQVMRTEHFDVYFYPEEKQAVGYAAELAERWRARLGAALQHELSGRQPLVLYAGQPHFQQTNVVQGFIGEGTGGVTEFLRRRMVLPFTTSLGETSHVLGHELVHAYQYDMGGQGTLGLPLWFIEGMAEYLSLGADHPLTEMWLRDAALREQLPDIDELDDPRLFPYRYGHALWAHLAKRFGEDIVPAIFVAASNDGDAAGAIERLTGESLAALSAEWHAAITATLGAVRGAERLPGRTLFGAAEDTDPLNVSPAISPDGRWVAFLSTRDVFSVDLYVADTQTGRVIRKLTETATDPHYESLQFIASAGAWDSSSRRLAFTAVSRGRPTLTIVDVEASGRKEERQLDGIQEAWHPSWSPDGRRIVFTGLSGGISDLYLYDLETRTIGKATDDAFADFQPAWSPDGSRIVFVTDRYGSTLERLQSGPYRLASVDVASRRVTALPAFDRGKHIAPQWGRSARELLLVAEPDGRPDLYRLDLGTLRFSRLTNVATGVSGITELSPPISYAPDADRVVLSVFTNGGYAMQVLDRVLADGERRLTENDADPSAGPGRAGGLADRGVALARAEAEATLPEVSAYPVEPYRPRLSLEFAGAAMGVGQFGQYGTFANGGLSLLFSDVLNRHQLATTVQTGGGLRDIGAQALYLNSEHRWTWGGLAGVVPYVTGAFGQQLETDGNALVVVERELIERQTEATAMGIAQYPFSRATRFEVQGGGRRIWFDRELTTRLFSYPNGAFLDESQENLATQPALNLAETSAALVHDQAQFGATGPILGQRYRFAAGQTLGSLRFSTVTLDYRRYITLARPFTLAVRGLHFGRYGAHSEDPRLSPLYLGYPTLVRGYDVNSFGAGECVPNEESGCPAFDQLVGSRLLVGNAELRAPLIGAFSGEYRYGAVPVDAFAFADTGVAWTAANRPSFADGSRDFVTSVGAGVRANVFGYVIIELAAIRPLDRPGRGWRFGFNLTPGF